MLKRLVNYFLFQTVLTYHLSSLLFVMQTFRPTSLSRCCRWLCITHRELCNDDPSLVCSLTPWSKFVLEKLNVSQQVKKFPTFYGTRNSLPLSQVPATCPFHVPARSSPYPHLPLFPFPLLGSYQIISPGPRLSVWLFRNNTSFFRWGVVNTSPNPQDEGPPLVGCPRLLFQYISSYELSLLTYYNLILPFKVKYKIAFL